MTTSVSAVEVEKEPEEDLEQPVDITAIKEYERQLAEQNQPVKEPEELIEFEQWWSLVGSKLGQPPYVKGILKVDAKARGVKDLETMERWNWAAKQYGLDI